MSSPHIDVAWLIDMDPPSELSGDRGFFPASESDLPPDEKLLARRSDAVLDVMRKAGVPAFVTVHTSPRYRRTFLDAPYVDVWKSFQDAGAALVLHPHEERADGSTFYDDLPHVEHVIRSTSGLAAEKGLTFKAFRSGAFSFNPALPQVLVEAGIVVDLFAAPGLKNPKRNIDWPEDFSKPDTFIESGVPLLEIPLGWDGSESDLSANYLYNETMDYASLVRIWQTIVTAAKRSEQPPIINFLCHGFGLVRPDMAEQALSFIRYMKSEGGHLIGLDDVPRLAARYPQAKPTR